MKPFGLIVAGGKSERFGSPKILHVFDGKPQWERLYDALTIHCEKIILNIPASLKEQFPDNAPFEFLLEEEHLGPLEGLCKAFETYPHRDWLVTACDHFWVDVATFQQLCRYPSAVFSDQEGQISPWLSRFSSHIVMKILEKRNQGEISLKKILEGLEIETLVPEKGNWILDQNYPSK